MNAALTLETAFTETQLSPAQSQRYETILTQARRMATTIATDHPGGGTEAQYALANLAQCVQWTRAAILAQTGGGARSGAGGGGAGS